MPPTRISPLFASPRNVGYVALTHGIEHLAARHVHGLGLAFLYRRFILGRFSVKSAKRILGYAKVIGYLLHGQPRGLASNTAAPRTDAEALASRGDRGLTELADPARESRRHPASRSKSA